MLRINKSEPLWASYFSDQRRNVQLLLSEWPVNLSLCWVGWSCSQSHWETASASFDISFDNIVWAKQLSLIPIVPQEQMEDRHHGCAHSEKTLKTIVLLHWTQFNSFTPVTHESEEHFLHINMSVMAPPVTAVRCIPPVFLWVYSVKTGVCKNKTVLSSRSLVLSKNQVCKCL